MRFLNYFMRPLFDVLLYPFRDLSPIIGIILVSLITAIGLLITFKKTSNQVALIEVKRKIHASLFEIRLFNDDLRAIIRAQVDILKNNLTYLRLSMIPMVWTLPPLILIVAQLQFHYGYQALTVGQQTILHVTLESTTSLDTKPSLTVKIPEGLRVQVPPIWVPSLREMSWKLIAELPGDHEIMVSSAHGNATKTIRVTDSTVRLSPVRIRGVWNELLYPAEAPLPKGSPYESIEVIYPKATISLFGWKIHWLTIYFALSILFAYSLKKSFGVTL